MTAILYGILDGILNGIASVALLPRNDEILDFSIALTCSLRHGLRGCSVGFWDLRQA